MRPIRSPEPGGQVQLEGGVRKFGRVTLSVDQTVRADLDVRRLLAKLHAAIEARFATLEIPTEDAVPTDRETDARAGRTQYRWRTMRDNRVRPEHRVREGRVFRWDTPPPDGDPGVPFGCRCHAEVYTDQDRRNQYRFTAVVGTTGSGGFTIEIVPRFVSRERWEIIANEVVPPVVAAWLADAVPSAG